ncbi:hypothetical protein ACFZAU_24225 [Streptomyces sp. NPDC008238]
MNVPKLRRSVGAGAFASAALIVATACNAGVDAASPPVGAIQASQPAPAPGLRTVDNAQLGRLVTDEKGWVLYRFEKDKPNPPTSNCADECAARWQPAAAVSDTQVQGVDQNLVGSVKRPDGTLQLTLNGMPLYHFTGDENPGDTKGQGADSSWYAATPDGAKAGTTAQPKSASSENGSDQY